MNCFSSLHLVLPYPPSVNHIYLRSKSGGVYLAPRYRRYLAEASASAAGQAREQGIATFIEPVFVEMVMTPPAIRRRRDADNLIKATFDALTKAKVWQDDSLVVRLLLTFAGQAKGTKFGVAELTIFRECE